MRLVIDTNVVLSGLLWQGSPHALMELARNGAVALVSSPALIEELADVLRREKFAGILARSGYTVDQVLDDIQRLTQIITPPPLPEAVCRDPDDDAVLAVTLAAQADLIVSGDDDLLALQSFQGIPILTPAEALTFCAQS